jgi:hypothetical protein
MRSPLFWFFILSVAVWQIEMAVQSGIAASRRPATTNKASATVCTGTVCPPSQQQLTPQRAIPSPR